MERVFPQDQPPDKTRPMDSSLVVDQIISQGVSEVRLKQSTIQEIDQLLQGVVANIRAQSPDIEPLEMYVG